MKCLPLRNEISDEKGTVEKEMTNEIFAIGNESEFGMKQVP